MPANIERANLGQVRPDQWSNCGQLLSGGFQPDIYAAEGQHVRDPAVKGNAHAVPAGLTRGFSQGQRGC